MRSYKEHLIRTGSKIIDALVCLNNLFGDAILFVIDNEEKLIGSLTDGDIRRGLIKGLTTEHLVDEIIQSNPRFLRKGAVDLNKVIEYREGNFRILPILDKDDRVTNVINFRETRSYLPIDAVVMAGGKGTRLRPLTNNIPKPLLKIGGKAIMEHNMDRLALFGIDDFWISVKYLGKQIEDHFGDGEDRNLQIRYVWEEEPLGTIGAVSMINDFEHEYVLITNSDILTNLDYEDFFMDFINQGSDFAVVTIPYQVNIPYAVLETSDGHIKSFKEKPTYTYYSNGGIYLMKKEVLKHIPKNTYYNTTDLMECLLEKGYKVTSYPLSGYWLDIGKHDDFEKAQVDIKQIKF
jgi:dTDP-glucose pyrophosphorylase